MSKDIKRYLIHTFGFTWVMWGIAIVLTRTGIASFGTPMMLLPYMLGGLSPAISEIYLMKRYGSNREFKEYIKNIVNPKHSVFWYIFIIVAGFIFSSLPVLYGGSAMVKPLYTAFLEFPFMIIGGGLEEIGWRGFLQPALQKRFSRFVSTFIVSVIWTAWHLPLWFIKGTHQEKTDVICFLFTVIALSYLLAALYNRTESIFLCIVMHALINGFWDVFKSDNQLLPVLPVLVFSLTVFLLMTGKNAGLPVKNKSKINSK